MNRYGFPKQARLLKSPQFNWVFNNQSVKISTRFFLLLAVQQQTPCRPRLGLVVAKKTIKRAVQRNRIKRSIRECFRVNQARLPHWDMVVLPRRGADALSTEQLTNTLIGLFNKLTTSAAAVQEDYPINR